MLQRCVSCDSWIYYPRVRCPTCLSDDLVWTLVSGHGRIATFTVARTPTAPAFADDVPQVIVVVELVEGPRLTSTLVGGESAEVHIGAEVEPVFDHGDDGITLLRFRPR